MLDLRRTVNLWTCGTWHHLLLLLPGFPEKDPIWISHRLPGVPVVLWMSPPMIDAVISVCRMDCKQWRIVKANASSIVRGKSFTFPSQSIKLVRRRNVGSAEWVLFCKWHWQNIGWMISVDAAGYTQRTCLYVDSLLFKCGKLQPARCVKISLLKVGWSPPP